MGREKKNEYVLAMYDIRSKQSFIYKSTRMKEIVGASLLIRDCFRMFLCSAAKNIKEGSKGIYGLYEMHEEVKEPDAFTQKKFIKHVEEDGYVGEVVYEGGGNIFVLYKNEEMYQKVNRLFYYEVLKGTYSMRVLSTYIVGVNFDDYNSDQTRLYAQHRINERKECAIHPVNTLPIVQVDYHSSMPLAKKYLPGMFKEGFKAYGEVEKKGEKVSYESFKKYEKYEAVMNNRKEKDYWIEGAKVLDNMITEKGKDSHLAIVYIDGNSMRAKIAASTRGKKSYEECIGAMRGYSKKIQENYIDNRIPEIDNTLGNKATDKSSESSNKAAAKEVRELRRFVVYAGDEITFICNAKQAYQLTKIYLSGLQGGDLFEELDEDGTVQKVIPTSCAGISIFHSHAPFADAYRIAEECCESGKKYMRKKGAEASFMDYHYCQGAIGISLENIRKHEGTEENTRPWGLYVEENKEPKYAHNVDKEKLGDTVTTNQLEDMAKELDKIGRSNIKSLASAAKQSKADFKKELSRIYAHQEAEKKPDFSLENTFNEAQQMKLIYDLVLVYDLWGDSMIAKKSSETIEG